jgi:hypothetical protein
MSARPASELWSTVGSRTARGGQLAVPILAAIVLVVVSLGGASSVAARTMVDPATLTPPLEPYRVCYQQGPWVNCDTSDVSIMTNEPAFELPCGVAYLSYTETRHATRWYRDGLLVERIVQARVRGTASLSPTGAGPTVDFAQNLSWDERFLVPGDLTSVSEVNHGNFLRVGGLTTQFHDAGIGMADGTSHGLFTAFTDESIAALCAALVS